MLKPDLRHTIEDYELRLERREHVVAHRNAVWRSKLDENGAWGGKEGRNVIAVAEAEVNLVGVGPVIEGDLSGFEAVETSRLSDGRRRRKGRKTRFCRVVAVDELERVTYRS